jgi:hypothetical protein
MRRALALVLLAGCLKSFAPSPRRGSAPLPDRNDSFGADAKRKRAAVANDTEFDSRFRTNIRDYGMLDGVNGVDRLRYPETAHGDAALAYVHLGDSAVKAGRWGAAGQAYWAALGLTSKTVASRRQREELRTATYRGLAAIAAHKQQPEWAALLALCAGLSETYLTSESAEAQHDEFYRVLESQLRAQRQAEAAEARARRGLLLQQIAAGVSAAATVAAGATGTISQAQVNSQAAEIGNQLAAAEQQSRELDQSMQEALGAISSAVGQLREVAAADVPEIQAGRAFVARQVGWYLLTARDPLRYFDGPLAAYARGRPPVRRAIEAARQAFTSGKPTGSSVGLHVGDRVSAQWTNDEWYDGEITAIRPDGTFDVDYDDGDHSDALPRARVRKTGGGGEPNGIDDARKKAIVDLTIAFMGVERHVAMHERDYVIPQPNYVQRVCGPQGGAVECFLSAGDLCRAGIEDGCALLMSLAVGGAP